MMMRLFSAILWVFLSASVAHAQAPSREHPAQVRLIADNSRIEPGQTFWLGVEFKLQPGWHVYWLNPGEAGEAPNLQLTLPEGFTAGEWQWPLPTQFDQGGGIVGYGYEDSVLLTCEVKAPPPPEAAQLTGPVTIGAKVTWLVCKDICLRGKTDLKLELPVGAATPSAEKALFETWQTRLPKTDYPVYVFKEGATGGTPDFARPAPHGPLVAISLTLLRSPPGVAVRTYVLWSQKPRQVEWFPGGDPALEVQNLQAEHDATLQMSASHTTITFDVKQFPGVKPASNALRSLLVYTDAAGVRRGVYVPVDLPLN